MTQSQTQTGKAWDFSQVYDLLSTITQKENNADPTQSPPRAASAFYASHSQSLPNDSPLAQVHSPDGGDGGGGVGLGDFSKVWQYLGAPLDTPAPKVNALSSHTPESPTLQQRVPAKADYTSDGAVYLTPSKKKSEGKGGIKWRDEANAGNLTDVAPDEDDATEQAEKLSKKARQRRNKQERKRLAAESETESRRPMSDFESEEEIEPRTTPARKASAHNLVSEPPTRGATTGLHVFEKKTASLQKQAPNTKSLITEAAPVAPSTPQPKSSAIRRQYSEPADVAAKAATVQAQGKVKKDWPVSNAKDARVAMFTPSSVQPPSPKSALQKAKNDLVMPAKAMPIFDSPTRNARVAIQPKMIRSGEDRHWAFLLKLMSDFKEDRGSLLNPALLSNHSQDPKGIHVFVDASNIFIGFHDQLKRARGIPQNYYVPRVNLSFDALALLMERRRPVAKRVLAGSNPHLPAFDTARGIGYECSILDKVLKAKELTDRQRYFQEQERKKSTHRSNGDTSAGSGSETNTAGPVFAPEKLVEQGVDEILHLKMMESLVDVDEPSTMVLATGDAAQAEYSQGFMKMVDRALQKGWRVEIVSWSKNVSQAYRKTAVMSKWSDRFRIIELDEYAEELLDM